MTKKRTGPRKQVETFTHDEESRKNIPPAEYQSVMDEQDREPIQVAYERRNRDLDPQLVWRGKDVKDWSDLVVPAPPLFIQEKVHPKVLIDDLVRQSESDTDSDSQPDLFADFNGLPEGDAKTEFYEHDANWSNRMILGDSLQVMASLAEREGLRGKVQCIYVDPPYGIKFNSNFQWSTTSRDVRDGKADHVTREPEQVKAFRDTWRDGIHSYLTYLRDRLTVARELLTESGSIFVQIGDENVHRVRALMDEIFGEENAFAVIVFKKKSFTAPGQAVNDYILHYARDRTVAKIRSLYGTVTTDSQRPDDASFGRILTIYGELVSPRDDGDEADLLAEGGKWCTSADRVISQHPSDTRSGDVVLRNRTLSPGTNAHWAFDPRESIPRLEKAGRLHLPDSGRLRSFTFWDDVPRRRLTNFWADTAGEPHPSYVVQTSVTPIQRCMLMTTDPGDLVLDPTCGSGTTAQVAEQWGRRWIAIDTSRVALALTRARVMGARYPYYLLADSPQGLEKEAALARQPVDETKASYGDIRQGFVYQRAPYITLKSIADNTDVDEIWEAHQPALEESRARLNEVRGEMWEEWEVPRRAEEPWEEKAIRAFARLRAVRQTTAAKTSAQRLLSELNAILDRSYTLKTLPDRPADPWPEKHAALHAEWWKMRIDRQREIDESIAAKADYEYLYDRPYEDKKRVRVSGPFTVESLSPHRELGVDENDDLVDSVAEGRLGYAAKQDFVGMILENLCTAGVQQAHKEDKLTFSSLVPWPGRRVCAEGRLVVKEGARSSAEQRAAVLVGPEFGTVTRPDLAEAAREAAEAGFDVLIACAFNYEPHATEFSKLGRIPVLKARMNADLHMAEDLKNTGKGNLFVVFGEPDIEIVPVDDGQSDDGRIQVKIRGVDVFHPGSGEIRSDGPDGIACWFIDTDYDEESFFVRHAYFLGSGDPYKSLKRSLKAEINPGAWATLVSDISRPFDRPKTDRIAVKVINHLGDEVMKVFRV